MMFQHTDQNGNTTTYSWDGWGRLNKIQYPLNGITSFNYTPSTFETERDLNPGYTEQLVTFDGLGRESVDATEVSSGSWDRTETCDNGMGEKSQVSYPFSSSSGGGVGACSQPGDSFTWDALGRPLLETHSDNTTIEHNYFGRASEVEDEGNGASGGGARITRISQVNGIGQLAFVCEVVASNGPANGPGASGCGSDTGGALQAANGYVTAYSYDPLGNLVAVAQGGEARSFAYDGASRLTSASNPETGATRYQYDSDGNCPAPNDSGHLISRTDARGVRTCYQYDALNRVTAKTYSDTTPAVTLAYGQSSAYGLTLGNTIGRLSSEQTASETATVYSYDAKGRNTDLYEFTPQTWGGTPFHVNFGYDLADRTLTEAYSGGATLTATYDLGGEPVTLASSTAGTLISSLSYNPRSQETARRRHGV